MAGPERPPVTLAIFGRRVRTSIAMPTSVLMSESASAPASSAARAIARMSVTFGDSFGMTGRPVASRAAFTTWYVSFGSVEKSSPPATLGHETFNSMPATPPGR